MTSLKRHSYAICLLLVLSSSLGFAQPIKLVYLYADSEQKQTFQSILQVPNTLWQQASTPNFGKEGGTGWVKFNIDGKHAQTLWLEAQSHFIDSLSMMIVENSANTDSRKVHISSSQEKFVKHRYFLFHLHLRASTLYTIYLKGYVPAPDVLKFPLVLWQPTDFLNFNQKDHWGWAIFVGFMLMAIVISIINYIFQPNSIYLFYAGYVGCITVYALLNDGWGTYLPKPLLFLDHNIILGHWLNIGLCYFLLFSRKFLALQPNREEWWLRLNPIWLTILIEIVIGFVHVGYWFKRPLLFEVSYQLGMFFSLFYCVWWVLYVRDAFQRGFRPVWLHVASVAVSIIFYFSSILLINSGLLKGYFPDMLVFRWVIIIDVLLILIGWVYRQQVYQKMQKLLELEVQFQKEAIYQANERQQAEEIKALRFQNELQHQRERLARDLHDGIGSQLTYIASRLDAMAFRLPNPHSLNNLSDFTRETNQILRETIWVLNQESILFDAFQKRLIGLLIRIWEDREIPHLQTKVVASYATTLPPLIVSALFRITQEAVHNALKHATATQVTLSLHLHDSTIHLQIEDNGKGFNIESDVHGYGLDNMCKRTEELGGKFKLITSSKGTAINITIPLTH